MPKYKLFSIFASACVGGIFFGSFVKISPELAGVIFLSLILFFLYHLKNKTAMILALFMAFILVGVFVSFAKWNIEFELHRQSLFGRILFQIKEKSHKNLDLLFESPDAGFIQGLILGEESAIAKDLKQKFNLAGVSHIVAVSGSHTSFIAAQILTLLLSLGLWRRQALGATLLFVFLYVLFVGAPASALRAGVMGGMFLLGQNIGRKPQSFNILILSLLVLLLLSPQSARLDLGLQLSFAAVLGMILFQDFFLDVFQKLPDKWSVRKSLAITLSASVFVLPLLVYYFKTFSLLFPFSNVLLLPLVGPLMILAFLTVFASFLSLGLAKIFSILIFPASRFFIESSQFFANFKFLIFHIEGIYFYLFLVVYGFIIAFLWYIRELRKDEVYFKA